MTDETTIITSNTAITVNRPVVGVPTKDNDSDNVLVSKGWITNYVQEAVTEALREQAKAFKVEVKPPISIVPDVLVDEPTIDVTDKQSFLAAVADTKSGDAKKGSDGNYRILLKNNIDLTGGSGETVMQNVSDLIVLGNGHSFFRTRDQAKHRMFNIVGAKNLTFNKVKFTDGKDGIVGETGSTPQMILIQRSFNVVMDDVYVSDSKGYAIYVRETKVFKFINSEMERSGILGLYVGHDDRQASTGVEIRNNYFHDNATNAVALQGVTGEIKNFVTDNTFERNHLYGRFPVAPKYGTGMTGGGQLYLANVDNLVVSGNKIRDGYCINCVDKSSKTIKNVTGIELSGIYGDTIKVKNVIITDNDITNNDGKGISQNLNSKLDDTTKIYGNRVSGNGKDYSLQDIKAA